MANPDHLAILEKGLDAWNQWRANQLGGSPDLSGAELQGADLSGAELQGADLSGASLHMADLNGATLDGADLSGATLTSAKLNGASLMGGTDLSGANLSMADLNGATLDGADLSGATLTLAKLNGATLTSAKLNGANLSRAKLLGANLYQADLSRAVIHLADLSDADLRKAKGVQLDETFVRNTRFSPDAADHWSVLRRNYTGPRLLFHLLLLIAFLSPYGVRTAWLVGLNEVQMAMKSFSKRLQPVAEELKNDDHRSAVVLGEVMQQMARVEPCLRLNCDETVIWKVLLGIDRVGADVTGWGNVLLAISLLIYNLCRGLLTWKVGPLREEEERSGYSPAYGGRDGYGWLFGFHRVVEVLLYVAGTSFLIHAWGWLTMPVWVLPA